MELFSSLETWDSKYIQNFGQYTWGEETTWKHRKYKGFKTCTEFWSGKRPLTKPRRRWEDSEIIMDLREME